MKSPKEKIEELIKFEKTKPQPCELTGEIRVPKPSPDASYSLKPYLLNNKEQLEDLGYPADGLIPNWKEVFLNKMREILRKYKSLRLFMHICSKCGNCADKCHFYLGTGDPKNMPVTRQELMRKIYRRYFTPQGRLFGAGIVGGEELSEELLALWYTYFYQCSGCRRCSVFCPYGIDTAEITLAAREILNSIGLVQRYLHETLYKAKNIGNNLGMKREPFMNTIEFMEEDLREETGVDIRMPVDEEGADVLLVVPSADYYVHPHTESLTGYAKVLHKAGISWTFSSYATEGANFGVFVLNYANMKAVNARIWKAARELNVKRVIRGECGHMWRVMSSFSNTMCGPFDGLDGRYPIPEHICEFTIDLLRRGALKIDKSANDEFVVTMHDPCNVARGMEMGGTENGQFDIPREIIKSVCNRFVEMPEDTVREKTYCCGAGGGLISSEMFPLAVAGSMPRMQAYTKVKKENGANFLATICAYCKVQLGKVLPEYGYSRDEVGGVFQLLNRAIIL